ncbi:N-acetylmuramoyl-L-alanine amidase [Paenibacillus taihuensis]|uniref:N-acetylmuramoyl-L-alanine amidase n=1 Tax=Paenibacillus taihuensis TaxID=1156355 RepID=A0A3D9SGA0_9BACL|nr:N-acetylmuramoyl-L-alanine amidase [Paenibacillus taihuensis]REE88600.1 N-acetylmuramoyl-L-alanine amidase [Paenibacillus taihuensis]
MKKFVTAVLLLSFLISMFPAIVGAAEAASPKLYLNGKQLLSGSNPQIVGDTTFVPIRTVTEGLGFDVSWEKPIVTISNGDTNMLLTIGDKTAIVNGQEAPLEKPAMISTGSTLVPLRFVGEQFGLQVYWDKLSRSVHLYADVSTPGAPSDNGSGSGNGGSNGSGNTGDSGNTGNGGSGSDPSTTDPNAGSTSLLKSIEYDGLGSISLPYDGDFGDVHTEVLHSPERIVIDLPNMNFAPDFAPGFTNSASKLGEILVDSHPTLQKVRFSYYSDKPSTVRIVLDLLAPTNYNVVKEEGSIRIDVLEQTGPPPVVTPPTGDGTTPDTPSGPRVYKVVLDAGHGGKDPGASSVNGRNEKEYNLAITLKVKALLDKETRIKPYLTRSNDTFIELDDRAAYANNMKADLFISFHANKAETASATGSETYYYHDYSKAFANIIHKHLIAGAGLKDRGVRTEPFRVVKATTMPAVLLEAGYLSNSNDSSVLFNAEKQDRIAAEIVKGIKEYLKLS